MKRVKDLIFSSIGLFGWIFLILKILKLIEWNWIIILIPFILVGFIQVIISDTVLGKLIMARLVYNKSKVIPYTTQNAVQKRIGFLKGQISVPANFDEMGRKEIAGLFEA